MELYIKGNYRGAIFLSDSGYTIGNFKVLETNDDSLKSYLNRTITFTGNFLELNEKDTYILYGKLINHPKYGYQYKVSHYERVEPDTSDKIIEFLSSKLFPKVSQKLAKSIVDMYGLDTLKVIKDNYQSLLVVPKMTEKKAKDIYDILVTYNESEDIIIKLTSLGFDFNLSLYFYNKYKRDILNIIDNNIYDLIEENVVSFKRIDEIRNNVGISVLDERRIYACICYVMDMLSFSNGNTYNSYDDIVFNTCSLIGEYISHEAFDQYFSILSSKRKIIIIDDKYYLPKYFDAEENISNFLIKLSKKSKKKGKFLNKIHQLEEKNDIVYNDKQIDAIESSVLENVLVITGGPGTGKTTLIKAIIELYQDINGYSFDELNKNLVLLAPTGRASKKMSENTSLPAYTIHRFLKWNKETNTFQVNEYNKSNVKFVIIDEVSMIDVLLFESLVKGLNTNVKLVLVGDYNQLPSVGAGQVLKDVIDSEKLCVVNLDLLYRQDQASYIPIFANKIKNEELLDLDTKRSDFCFFDSKSEEICDMLTAIVEKAIEKGYDYSDIQVLCPMYKGVNGIDNINKILQNIFNPKINVEDEIEVNDVIYRLNDKVIQLTNMPDENVFNGDIGIIIEVIPKNISESKTNELVVSYDGNIVNYVQKDFTNIRHAYAMSIHKSQGSEFNIIIMPICKSYSRMMYKKLIYTGVTRAKKSLILLGDRNVLNYSVKKEEDMKRKTSLCEMLNDE